MRIRLYFLGLMLICFNTKLSSQSPGGVKSSVAWFKTTTNSDNPTNQVLKWTDFSGSNYKLNISPDFLLEYTESNFTREMNFGVHGLYFSSDGIKKINISNSLDQQTVFGLYIPLEFNQDSSLWRYANNEIDYSVTLGEVIMHSSVLNDLDYGSIVGADWYTDINNRENRAKILSYRLFDKPQNQSRLYLTEPITKSNIQIANGLGAYVPEFIVYDRALSNQDRLKVETYLAVKYGITLEEKSYTSPFSIQLWKDTTNTTYHNRVTGISRSDTSNLNQKKSVTHYEESYQDQYVDDISSSGGLTVNNANRLLAISTEPQGQGKFEAPLTYYRSESTNTYSLVSKPGDTLFNQNDKAIVSKPYIGIGEDVYVPDIQLKEGDRVHWYSSGTVSLGVSSEPNQNGIKRFLYQDSDKLSIGAINEIDKIYTRWQLKRGEGLIKGEEMVSQNGKYKLIMQHDGNLVLYTSSDDCRNIHTNKRAVWASNTVGSGADRLNFQWSDGNFVMYSGHNPKWASNTVEEVGDRLILQNDGNFVMYFENKPKWATNTENVGHGSCNISQENEETPIIDTYLFRGEELKKGQEMISQNRKYKLIMQHDGNLVLYASTNDCTNTFTNKRAVWASNTVGSGADRLNFQWSDGNFVMYSGHNPKWASNTVEEVGDRLLLQNDGNLVMYFENKPKWATNTENVGHGSCDQRNNLNIFNKKWSYIPGFDKLTLEIKGGKILYYKNGYLLNRQSNLLNLSASEWHLFFKLGSNESYIRNLSIERFKEPLYIPQNTDYELTNKKNITVDALQIIPTSGSNWGEIGFTIDQKLEEGDYITWNSTGETMVGISSHSGKEAHWISQAYSLYTSKKGLFFKEKGYSDMQFYENDLKYDFNDQLKLEIKNGRVLYYKNNILLNNQSNILHEGNSTWTVDIAMKNIFSKISNLQLFKANRDYQRLDESYALWGDDDHSIDLQDEGNQLIKGVHMLERKWKINTTNYLRLNSDTEKEPASFNVELSLNRINQNKEPSEQFPSYSGAKPSGSETSRRNWLIIDDSGEGTFALSNTRFIEQSAHSLIGNNKLWFQDVVFDENENEKGHFTFGYTDGFLIGTKQDEINCNNNTSSLKFWVEGNTSKVPLYAMAPFQYKIFGAGSPSDLISEGEIDAISDSIQVDNLPLGDYQLEVVDKLDVSVLASVNLSSPSIDLFIEDKDQIFDYEFLTYDLTTNSSYVINGSDNINPSLVSELNYTWTLPDGSEDNTEEITINQEGIYSLKISDANTCMAIEDSFEVRALLSDTMYANNPTRAGDDIRILVNTNGDVVVNQATIYQGDGKTLKTYNSPYISPQNIITLDPINRYGVYYIAISFSLNGENKVDYFKLIIN